MQLTACDTKEEEIHTPQFDAVFGMVNIEVSEDSATITADTPYYTLDENKYDGVVSLIYGEKGTDRSAMTSVTQLESLGDKLITTIEGLEPATTYESYIIIDCDSYGVEYSPCIEFTTSEHITKHVFNATSHVTAYGLYATIELTDVSYTADGAECDIAMIYVEYAAEGDDQYKRVGVEGDHIANGTVNFTIPTSTTEQLAENTTYHYYVTAEPENEGPTLMTEERSFTTTTATTDPQFAELKISSTTETIIITIDQMTIIKDGRYTIDNIEKSILYRIEGSEAWSVAQSSPYGNGGLYVSMPIGELQADSVYEVCAQMKSGGETFKSDIESFDTPKNNDTPAPEPPKDGDTTAIAGTWHLVEWCGTTPSFEVYLDIDTTGNILLYQKMQSREWECYKSLADITDEGIIWGVYSDGVAWGTSYTYSLAGNRMTWINVNDSNDISVYEPCSTLPEGLAGIEREATRSTCGERFL